MLWRTRARKKESVTVTLCLFWKHNVISLNSTSVLSLFTQSLSQTVILPKHSAAPNNEPQTSKPHAQLYTNTNAPNRTFRGVKRISYVEADEK